ncbi:MAG TPA: hypothetical protein VGE60_10105 [Telluria sp.]
MQTIPEQISSATRAPIEAQLELFGSIAMAAVENTGRLALLQLDASRAAVDQACAAWRQMLGGGTRNATAPAPQPGPDVASSPNTAHADQPSMLQQVGATARGHDNSDVGEDRTPAPEPVAHPHAAEPPAHRTPIAEAAAQIVTDAHPGAPIAAAAPAATDAPVALPKVKPIEAAPPPSSHSQGFNQRKGVPRK